MWASSTPMGPKQRASNVTPVYLVSAYDLFNEQYFNKRLPSSRMVDVRFGLAHGNLGETSICPGGYYIEVNRRLNPADKQVYMTLLHEECHIATWGEIAKDGPKWQSCMHKLADEGAFDTLW